MKLNEGTNVEITLPENINSNYSLPDPILIQLYQDRHNRVIWMLNSVGEEAFDWIEFILNINREDKGIPVEERKPIKCIISNYGGDLENARMLSSIISLSKTPIYGYCVGMCASAASIIYLSCHKRFALPNSTFLFHQGGCDNISGTYGQISAFMNSYKKEIEELTEFYKTHTTYSEAIVEEKLAKGDWYIQINEALEKGIVNELINDIDMFF